ncbi:putative ABC transporter permease subunit [Pseudobacteroides cellulosolvens]|uniref:ABC-2 type transport system permease protein n=1 Tax=Pseudobacteroides cellulosolvens ATCC 35603 = DSM 2933 TaxID=398512 RepID=A0A0L6JS23_9FIRM|nr:hypothetical protein [Pseudobacteroides cellulosolvens]KNY28505.1 hypothetical protein Bccel_3779 [Pseudobacteroides cellulosolvens ATCC 35603 = DSM 2933]
MKTNTILLARILLKGSGNASESKRKWILWIILGVAFLPMIAQLGFFTSISYDVLKNMKIETLIPAIILALTSFVVFFFGIFYILNTYYFTKDIESLLPLPLRPFEIIGAKFIVVTIYEYLTEIVVLAPVLLVYGVKSGGGILYYLYAAVIFLTLPVIPLVISSLIIMPLMRFTGLIKNKDRFRYFASIIAIGIGVGVQFGVRRFVDGNLDQGRLESTLAQLERNVSTVTSFFPSAKYAAMSLIRSVDVAGIINMLLFLGLTAIILIVFLYLSQILYFKGVMGISETGSKRRAMSNMELKRATEKRPVAFTYFLKEIRIILRTPPYFINCILGNFIWPVIILISSFSNSNNGMSLEQLGSIIRQNGDNGLILAIGFAFSVFLSSSNSVTSTAISREGQNMYFNKYIPLGYDKQILMKVMSGVAVGVFGVSITLIFMCYMIKLSIYTVTLMFVVGLIGIIFSSFTGIVFDLINPKLNWDNEQKAVKQNFNVLFNMLAGIIFAGAFIALIFVTGLNLLQTFIASILIFGTFIALLYYLVSTIGVKLLKRIEG